MSRLRMTVSRLLALGGLTTVTGSSYALYRYKSLGESPTSIADCKRASPPTMNYGNLESDPLNRDKLQWDDDWDKRNPKFTDIHEKVDQAIVPVLEQDKITKENPKPFPKPTATRHLILVRHGQYIMESDDDKNRVLTDIGRQQAAATRERLKALNKKLDRIVVSTMTRAQETASIIKEGFPDTPTDYCSLLREGAPYPPEPKSSTWRPERMEFFKDNPRIEGAFRKYIHRADAGQQEDSHELIVCHGNVIRYFVCRALQFPPEGWLRMSVGNCGVTWLTIRPNGRVSLRGLGDVGHLPPDLITFN